MDVSDILAHRTALIGTAVAAAIGLAGGLVMRTGPQTAPEPETYLLAATPTEDVEPIVWPTGKVPDYVIGTDFLTPPQPDPAPEVVASEPLPYEPPPYEDPLVEPEPEPEQLAVVDAPPAPRPPPAPIAVAAMP
ncbi:hypothetical protein [Caulobacter sp. LARHSG274]